jgi:hypothetical protein
VAVSPPWRGLLISSPDKYICVTFVDALSILPLEDLPHGAVNCYISTSEFDSAGWTWPSISTGKPIGPDADLLAARLNQIKPHVSMDLATHAINEVNQLVQQADDVL